MGRPPAQLSPASVSEVLGYLKAAALREPGLFQPAGHPPETRLLMLARELAAGPEEFRHLVLGEWVVKHVTPEGRTRMFATLRRRRADAKGKPKAVSLRLAADDAKELQKLAKQLGMPAALALRTLVFIAAADKDLRAQVARLAVATGLGEKAAKKPGSTAPLARE